MQLILPLLLILEAAATEVVWLSPPGEADRDRVAAQAGARGIPLEPIDLWAAATDWSEEDEQAYAALEAALEEVRAYETKLDGELVIMRDLMKPLDEIHIVRDEDDRSELYGALAYQGFAVNRFFGTSLAEDEQAADHRVEVDGVVVEKPWLDAVALDPEREVTPYDIAEAPQRVAYGEVAKVVTSTLPASFTPTGLPEGATLVIDGRPSQPGPSGNIKLAPGRHMAHVELEGRVIARWDFRLGPGDTKEMGPELDAPTFNGFLNEIGPGATVPEALVPSIEFLGGEVWIARPGAKEPEVFALTPSAVTPVELEKIRVERPGSDDKPVALVAGAQGGWFYSGDFLLQEPLARNAENSTVNAGSVSVLVAADFDLSGFHAGVGVQTWMTLGDDHVAKYGTKTTRLRPYPHVMAGIRYVQLTLGYLLPYHPGVGGRAMIPVSGPVELHLSGLFGVPGKLKYEDGTEYETGDVRSLSGGIGVRF